MTLDQQEISKLFTVITNSLKKVYQHDGYLIENKVHERTIVARFAIYFQEELNRCGYKEYDMDVEYNKDHSNPKKTKNFPKGTFPDVIVHKRGSNEHNLCIIEFKKDGRNTKDDIKKLRDFTNQKDKYMYGVGYSIIIDHDCPTLLQVMEGDIVGKRIRIEVPT
jgi:effector-binding domain-containing protein